MRALSAGPAPPAGLKWKGRRPITVSQLNRHAYSMAVLFSVHHDLKSSHVLLLKWGVYHILWAIVGESGEIWNAVPGVRVTAFAR